MFSEEYEGLRKCTSVQVGARGFEPDSVTLSGATDIGQQPALGGAKSGAVGALPGSIDADLRAIIESWPKLPEESRRVILGIVRDTQDAPTPSPLAPLPLRDDKIPKSDETRPRGSRQGRGQGGL